MEKKIKYYRLIKLAVFVAIAILTFFLRDIFINYLKYSIGGLMLLYGFEEVAFGIIFKWDQISHDDKLYLGFIELLFGSILLFTHIDYESVCIIWATWSIVRESYEIKEIIVHLKNNILKVVSGIESLTIIVFSVILILNPTQMHAMIHLYILLLVELILTPLIPILDEIKINNKH